MTVRLPSQRPDCEQIQKKKHLWALIKEELEINDEMENIIASKERENKFTIYSMLGSESESESQNLRISESQNRRISESHQNQKYHESSTSDSGSEELIFKGILSPKQREEQNQNVN